jgi:hypothetical protein
MKNRPKRYQPTSDELRDKLLHFIQTHFYQGQFIPFAKARPFLLERVIFKLATYLDEKDVTIGTDRYLEIMQKVLMEALQFGDTANIGYLPAWLGKCVDSHLSVHGEKYYEEGKVNRANIQTHLAAALKIAQAGVQGRDPVREMAAAARLLKAKRKPFKAPQKQQLTLL